MAWQEIADSDGELSGDAVWDAFADVFARVARIYEARFHRKPTVRELRYGFDFVLRGTPSRFVIDPEQLDPGAGASRRRLNADHFEAASGDMQGEVEPAFISRRGTRVDVVCAWLERQGRVLLCTYQILDNDIRDDEARWLFTVCYLKVLTGDYLADEVDVIRFVPRDRPAESRDEPYPQ